MWNSGWVKGYNVLGLVRSKMEFGIISNNRNKSLPTGTSVSRKSSLPVPGLPHRKSSRSSSVTSSAALIGSRTPAYDEKHR